MPTLTRILVLTHRFPYPPDKGDRIRSFYWIQSLARHFEVDVLTLTHGPAPEPYRRELEALAGKVYTFDVSRSYQIGRIAGALLAGRSLTEGVLKSEPFTQKLQELAVSGRYDACLAVGSGVGAQTLKALPFPRLIVDLVDVDSAKWDQYARCHRGISWWVYRRESRKIANLERKLAQQAQTCVVVSYREADLLRRIAPEARVQIIPNGVDTEFFQPPDRPGPVDRLVFVGQMDYFPNVDAVVWFAEHVWPELTDRFPRLRWNIVGRNPVRAVRQLSALRNVQVTGQVPDVRPFLRAAVAVVPIRLSCGVQNKALEALAAGCPVVTTPAVAAGLDVRAQDEWFIADTPREWVAAIDLLMNDQALAQKLGVQARAAVMERFTWNQTAEAMRQLIQTDPNAKSAQAFMAQTLP